MKTHLTLTQLAQQLEDRATNKQDYVVDTRKLTMTEDSKLSFENGVRHDLQVNDVAHKQIAARLEIPGRYYDKMRGESPALLAKNVNHWFANQPETRMVRTLNHNVRAFLSDRYQRIENEEIAGVVLPVLLEQQGVQIASASITETRMYIKAVFTHIRGEVRVGEVVQSGVIISNSEVGMGAVTIDPFAEVLKCTNGMVMRDSRFSARHLGGRVSEGDGVYEMLTDETIKADDKAIVLKVRDVLRGCFDEVRFQRSLALMQDSTQQRLEGNPAEAVKVLAKRHQFSEFEQGSVLRHLIEGGDVTRWGLLNAVTRTAQDCESYDRATDLETIGGNMLVMTPTEWKPLALAA
jgi:hypothetical protein